MKTRAVIALILLTLPTLAVQGQSTLPRIAEGEVDTTNHETAGLPPTEGVRTVTIFTPTDNSHHYANGAAITAFRGVLYCMWQSSQIDEDAPDTRLVYSRSIDDGATWTAPQVLDAATDTTYSTSGGWLACGDTLVAFINRWPTALSPTGGFTYYTLSTDGLCWSTPQPVTMDDGSPVAGVIEQDPLRLSNGRVIGSMHFQPGLHVCPIYTDSPLGIDGWHRATFQSEDRGKQSRELEPSQYVKPDGTLVMLFRDQSSSFRRMASLSADGGLTWTSPTLTDMPDARTKQCAGNLPDGTSFIVSCPANDKRRWPLVLLLSDDGTLFSRAILLRSGLPSDMPPRRYEGRYKTLGYSYPKATTHNGKLYVAYSVNKESVECTIVTFE